MIIKGFDLNKMDIKYLNKAEKVTSFNLNTKDLTTVNPARKNEIRYLFLRYFFPTLKSNVFISSNSITKNDFNSSVAKLKAVDKFMFDKLHNYKSGLSGIGPGEVTMFFVYDNAYLGGGTSKGVDIRLGSSSYEVKAIEVDAKNRARGFFTGSAIDFSEFFSEMVKVAKSVNEPATMQGIAIKKIREKAPDQVRVIEEAYADYIYNQYFKGHEIVFINNKDGTIAGVKEVKPKDITFDAFTQSRIKPRVQL